MESYENHKGSTGSDKNESRSKELFASKGGLPSGWTEEDLGGGEIRYEGPNGSYFIVRNSF